MRARNIKPGFFMNEKLAELDPYARLLFIGLWGLVDREGRMEDRPIRIKAEVLPYNDIDCHTLLDQLDSAGFIVRYSVKRVRYIQVKNFTKHQNPHPKEKASEIPTLTRKPRKAALRNVKTGKKVINTAESLILNPESLNPESVPREPCHEFDLFWEHYPKKKGKLPAKKAWYKLDPDGILVGVILTALKRQAQSHDWQKDNGQFIPMPATWLNQRRWEDEIESKPVSQQDKFFEDQKRKLHSEGK